MSNTTIYHTLSDILDARKEEMPDGLYKELIESIGDVRTNEEKAYAPIYEIDFIISNTRHTECELSRCEDECCENFVSHENTEPLVILNQIVDLSKSEHSLMCIEYSSQVFENMEARTKVGRCHSVMSLVSFPRIFEMVQNLGGEMSNKMVIVACRKANLGERRGFIITVDEESEYEAYEDEESDEGLNEEQEVVWGQEQGF